MKKDDHNTPKLSVKLSKLPSLSPEVKFAEVRYTKGTTQFSRLVVAVDDLKNSKLKQTVRKPDSLGLEWQTFSELNADHGLALSYQILISAGFCDTTKHTIESMTAEITENVGEQSWQQIEKNLLELDKENGLREIFLQAKWVELFAEPYEELWLAAMAQHAFYVLENDFAFGYLTAQIDQKRNLESHFLRGENSIKSASLGGLARSHALQNKTHQILNEMKRLIASGQSVARSADLAHKHGFGTSQGANKKLWERHSKK